MPDRVPRSFRPRRVEHEDVCGLPCARAWREGAWRGEGRGPHTRTCEALFRSITKQNESYRNRMDLLGPIIEVC